LELARTAGRIALTFVPFLAFKNHRSRRILKHAEKHANENEGQWEATKTAEAQKMKTRTALSRILLISPAILLIATIGAALERTPLTGRYVFRNNPLADELTHYTFIQMASDHPFS
jgi:hypothetical protein